MNVKCVIIAFAESCISKQVFFQHLETFYGGTKILN